MSKKISISTPVCFILILISSVFTNVVSAQNESTVRDTTYLRILNDKAADFIDQNRMDSAKVLINEALQIAEILNDLEGESYAVANLGKYYSERGMPDSSVTVLEENFEKYLETEKAIRIGNLLATDYQRLGNYSRALDLYGEMLALAEQRNDTLMIMGITQNMGNSYSSLGDIPAAIDSYLTSLEMAEEAQDTLVLAIVLDNLASVNTAEENYELAEEYLNRALNLNKQIDNRRNQVTNHMSFGGLYKDWGKYSLAKTNYDRALELSDQLDMVLSRIQAFYNLGLLYSEMDEFDRAMDMFEQSLEMSRDNNIPIGAFYNQSGMANVFAERQEYDRAIDLYENSLEVAERAQGIDMIVTTLQNLYETHEKAGDTTQAYDYLKRYTALRDSISKTERDEALARQEALLELGLERENLDLVEEAYQAQKRNSLIVSILLGILFVVLLITIWFYKKKQDVNRQLLTKTEELTKVNEVKDKLLSVLSHDLRSPISNIKGVIYLIRENVLKGKDINDALDEIDSKLQHGINTLTNYLQWAQNQRRGIRAELKEVTLYEAVRHALDEFSMAAKNKNITMLNKVDESLVGIADEHLLSVTLRNLISNAVKFVNREGEIKVSSRETENEVQLLVHDTGPGIPKEKQEDLFKPFNAGTDGSDGETGTGLGLSICKEFTEKQGGAVTFESAPGKGTTFIVHLQKELTEGQGQQFADGNAG